MNLASAMRGCWNAVSLVVLSVLVLLEPVVRVVCSAAMFSGVLVSIVFEISAVGPRFPFLTMLLVSLGLGIVLLLYETLVQSLIE